MKLVKTLAALSLALPVLAFAQSTMPRVDQRQANQAQRIEQGEASGSLTAREANRLERGQQHVNNMESRATADGVVTKREQVRLHEAQATQSRHIYREKHDRQHDFNHNGRVDHPRRR